MNKKKLFNVLYLSFLLTSLFSCGNDDSSKADSQNDALLVGTWTKDDRDGYKARATEMVLNADGTGRYTDYSLKEGQLNWSTEQGKLKISFAGGTTDECTYDLSGATMTTSDMQCYVLKLPILGYLYASGSDIYTNGFSYMFGKAGSGMFSYFNADGRLVSKTFAWNRIGNNKISLKLDGAKNAIPMTYNTSNDGVSFSRADDSFMGRGRFLYKNENDLIGTWTAEYTELGVLSAGGEHSGTIIMDDGSFYCNVIKDGVKFNRNYLMKVFIFNGLLVLKEDGGTEIPLWFRYRYARSVRQVFLEISEDEHFSHYVGYKKTIE